MADPSNVQAIEDVELMTKCVVQTFVSTPSDITKAIEKYYKHATDNGARPEDGNGPERRPGKGSG
ncbi:MAG: hypothetical protein COV75_00265 [Candidatus Omnitrophica bacterium CG11_big_fil_rev_8_21_14_0_20_63_9]|nr:MAG: hypothetical protein COV75_00265 [Candidatus Omnitrophica bacterium CG11_big_fil_rev_8_21_14_0_20_63_9]